MASTDLAPKDDNAPAPLPEHILEQVRSIVAQVPGDDGTGGQRIVEQLLAATSIDDLNAPWEGTSGRSLNGRRLRVLGITQRPSQFDDGAGIFLVVQAADAKTGEAVTFTTSAVAVVLQLAQAWVRGMFPLLADVVVAQRPTSRGFYPYHLQILAAANATAAGSTDGDR